MLKRLASLLCLTALPALAEPIEIQSFAGPVTLETMPETVAVFDMAAMDTLNALGVDVDGLVRPFYLEYLEMAGRQTTPVGTLFEPDLEAVFALNPDLIVAGGRASSHLGNLAKIAPTLDMTIRNKPVQQGLERLASYGEIFGKQDKATELAAAFQAKLQATRAALSGKGTALTIMTNGPKISAYGAGGRFGWLHTELGLKETIEGVENSTHGEAVSFEFIREADPDILIVIDRLSAIGQDGANARATLDNVLVHDTKAWKSGQVVYLSSGPLYIAHGGIQSMSLTLDEMKTTLAGN